MALAQMGFILGLLLILTQRVVANPLQKNKKYLKYGRE